MTGNEYQQLAMRTCQDPILDHAIFGLASEACSALDLKLEDVMEQNIEKLRKRYPNGFEAEKSINRDKTDI